MAVSGRGLHREFVAPVNTGDLREPLTMANRHRSVLRAIIPEDSTCRRHPTGHTTLARPREHSPAFTYNPTRRRVTSRGKRVVIWVQCACERTTGNKGTTMQDPTFRDALAQKLGEDVADELIRRLEPAVKRRESAEDLEEAFLVAVKDSLSALDQDDVQIAAAVGVAAKPIGTGVGSGAKTGVGTGVGVRIGTQKF